MASEGKTLVNDLYHAAVVGGLAIGYAKLGQVVLKGPLPRLDFTPRDAATVVFAIGLATESRNQLVKHGLIPADILK